MTYDRFPGAPDGSYVNEDGWLIIGEEAWTEAGWAERWRRPKSVRQYQRPATDEERLEAKRRSARESMRRRRERKSA